MKLFECPFAKYKKKPTLKHLQLKRLYICRGDGDGDYKVPKKKRKLPSSLDEAIAIIKTIAKLSESLKPAKKPLIKLPNNKCDILQLLKTSSLPYNHSLTGREDDVLQLYKGELDELLPIDERLKEAAQYYNAFSKAQCTNLIDADEDDDSDDFSDDDNGYTSSDDECDSVPSSMGIRYEATMKDSRKKHQKDCLAQLPFLHTAQPTDFISARSLAKAAKESRATSTTTHEWLEIKPVDFNQRKTPPTPSYYSAFPTFVYWDVWDIVKKEPQLEDSTNEHEDDIKFNSDESDTDDNEPNTAITYDPKKEFYEQEQIKSLEMKDKLAAVQLNTKELDDYEVVFDKLLRVIKIMPSEYKFEVYECLFPIFAIIYLNLIRSNNYQRAKRLLRTKTHEFDDLYLARLNKLKSVQSVEQIKSRARNFLNGCERIKIQISSSGYQYLLNCIATWTLQYQMIIIKHLQFEYYNYYRLPRQMDRPLIRVPKIKISRETGSQESTVPDFEPISREKMPSMFLYSGNKGPHNILSVAIAEGLTLLAVGMDGSIIYIYSIDSKSMTELQPAAALAQLDPNCPGVENNIMNPERSFKRRMLCGHHGPVYTVVFGRQDKYLLSGAGDNTIRFWCLRSWNCFCIFTGHVAAVHSLSASKCHGYFVTGSEDKTACVWSINSKTPTNVLSGHLATVSCCIFHTNRRYFATGSLDCTVRVWDIKRNLQVRLFAAHRQGVTSLVFSKCGKYLLSGAINGDIILWDINANAMMTSFLHHKQIIRSMEVSMDNNLLIVGSLDGKLSMWDLEKILKNELTTNTNKKATEKMEKSEKSDKKNMSSDKKKYESDYLVQVYPTQMPIYKVFITARNLVLAFNASTKKPEAEYDHKMIQGVRWFHHLDYLKMEACRDQENIIKQLATIQEREENIEQQQESHETPNIVEIE